MVKHKGKNAHTPVESQNEKQNQGQNQSQNQYQFQRQRQRQSQIQSQPQSKEKEYVNRRRSSNNKSVSASVGRGSTTMAMTTTSATTTMTSATSTNGINYGRYPCPTPTPNSNSNTNSSYSLDSTPYTAVDSDSDESEYMNVTSVINSIGDDSDPDCSTSTIETCIVCNKEINPDDESTSENLFRELCTKKRLLSALSVVLRISPATFYPCMAIDINSLPNQIYCSDCSKTICQSISIIRKIENLNKSLDINKNELKQNFIHNYQHENDCEGVSKKLAAKNKIRKTFVQCFTTCEVPLEPFNEKSPPKLVIRPSNLNKGTKNQLIGSKVKYNSKADVSTNTVTTIDAENYTNLHCIARCIDGSTNTVGNADAATATDVKAVADASTRTNRIYTENVGTLTNARVDASVGTTAQITVDAATLTHLSTSVSTNTIAIVKEDVCVNTNRSVDATTNTELQIVSVSSVSTDAGTATSNLSVEVDVSTLSGIELDTDFSVDSISNVQSDTASATNHISASANFDISVNSTVDSSTNFIAAATSPYFNPDSSTNAVNSYDVHSQFSGGECSVSFEPRFNPDCSTNSFDIASYNSPFNPDCSTNPNTDVSAIRYRDHLMNADCSTPVIHTSLSNNSDCSYECQPEVQVEDITRLRTVFQADSHPSSNNSIPIPIPIPIPVPILPNAAEPEVPESTTATMPPEPAEPINSTNDIVLTAANTGLSSAESFETAFPCGSRAELESLEDFNFSLLDPTANCTDIDSVGSESQDSSSADTSLDINIDNDNDAAADISAYDSSPASVPYPLSVFVEPHEEATSTSASANVCGGDDSEGTNSQPEPIDEPPRKFITKAAMKEYQECPRRKLRQQVKVKAKQVTRRRKQQGMLKTIPNPEKTKPMNVMEGKEYVSKVLTATKQQLEDDYKYKCTICGKGYHLEKFFNDHTKYHEGVNNHSCTECDRHFASALSLRRHQRQLHSTPGRRRTSKNRGFKKSATIQFFKCYNCGLEFYKKNYWVKRGVYLFNCDLGCEDNEKTYSQFTVFMRHHKKACLQLQKTRAQESEEVSLASNSVPLPPPPPLQPAPKLSVLPQPHQQTKSLAFQPPPSLAVAAAAPAAVAVEKTSDEPDRISENAVHKTRAVDSSFSCTVCNRTYANSNTLGIHMATFHSNVFKFICDICGKSFPFASLLTSHLVSHSNSTLQQGFRCELCTRSFASARGLKCHKKHIHTVPLDGNEITTPREPSLEPTDTHQCKACPKTFDSPDLLKQHQKAMHNKKPGVSSKKFACSLCKKSFPSRAQVRIHIWAHKRSRQSRKAEYQCMKKVSTSSEKASDNSISSSTSKKIGNEKSKTISLQPLSAKLTSLQIKTENKKLGMGSMTSRMRNFKGKECEESNQIASIANSIVKASSIPKGTAQPMTLSKRGPPRRSKPIWTAKKTEKKSPAKEKKARKSDPIVCVDLNGKLSQEESKNSNPGKRLKNHFIEAVAVEQRARSAVAEFPGKNPDTNVNSLIVSMAGHDDNPHEDCGAVVVVGNQNQKLLKIQHSQSNLMETEVMTCADDDSRGKQSHCQNGKQRIGNKCEAVEMNLDIDTDIVEQGHNVKNKIKLQPSARDKAIKKHDSPISPMSKNSQCMNTKTRVVDPELLQKVIKKVFLDSNAAAVISTSSGATCADVIKTIKVEKVEGTSYSSSKSSTSNSALGNGDHSPNPHKSRIVVSFGKVLDKEKDKDNTKEKDKGIDKGTEKEKIVIREKSPGKHDKKSQSHSPGRSGHDSRKSIPKHRAGERSRSRSHDITQPPKRKSDQDSKRSSHTPRKHDHDRDHANKIHNASSPLTGANTSQDKKGNEDVLCYKNPSSFSSPMQLQASSAIAVAGSLPSPVRDSRKSQGKESENDLSKNQSKAVDNDSNCTALITGERAKNLGSHSQPGPACSKYLDKNLTKNRDQSSTVTHSTATSSKNQEHRCPDGALVKIRHPVVLISRTKTKTYGGDKEKDEKDVKMPVKTYPKAASRARGNEGAFKEKERESYSSTSSSSQSGRSQSPSKKLAQVDIKNSCRSSSQSRSTSLSPSVSLCNKGQLEPENIDAKKTLISATSEISASSPSFASSSALTLPSHSMHEEHNLKASHSTGVSLACSVEDLKKIAIPSPSSSPSTVRKIKTPDKNKDWEKNPLAKSGISQSLVSTTGDKYVKKDKSEYHSKDKDKNSSSSSNFQSTLPRTSQSLDAGQIKSPDKSTASTNSNLHVNKTSSHRNSHHSQKSPSKDKARDKAKDCGSTSKHRESGSSSKSHRSPSTTFTSSSTKSHKHSSSSPLKSSHDIKNKSRDKDGEQIASPTSSATSSLASSTPTSTIMTSITEDVVPNSPSRSRQSSESTGRSKSVSKDKDKAHDGRSSKHSSHHEKSSRIRKDSNSRSRNDSKDRGKDLDKDRKVTKKSESESERRKTYHRHSPCKPKVEIVFKRNLSLDDLNSLKNKQRANSEKNNDNSSREDIPQINIHSSNSNNSTHHILSPTPFEPASMKLSGPGPEPEPEPQSERQPISEEEEGEESDSVQSIPVGNKNVSTAVKSLSIPVPNSDVVKELNPSSGDVDIIMTIPNANTSAASRVPEKRSTSVMRGMTAVSESQSGTATLKSSRGHRMSTRFEGKEDPLSSSRKRRSERLECAVLEKKRIICIDILDDDDD